MLSSEQENMEDLLTSSVFGAFQYGNASDGLICFLKKSMPTYGVIPFGHDLEELQIHFDDYDFWPQWTGLAGVENCEPDLLIEIRSSASKNILVLAKGTGCIRIMKIFMAFFTIRMAKIIFEYRVNVFNIMFLVNDIYPVDHGFKDGYHLVPFQFQ